MEFGHQLQLNTMRKYIENRKLQWFNYLLKMKQKLWASRRFEVEISRLVEIKIEKGPGKQ